MPRSVNRRAKAAFLLCCIMALPVTTVQAAPAFRAASSGAQAASGSSSITYVGSGNPATATSGNVTPTLPGALTSGDLLLCLVVSRDNVAHAVSGWIPLYSLTGSDHRASLFYKIAGASESNPTVSHSGGDGIATRCSAFRGVDATTPFDVAHAARLTNNDDKINTGSLTTVTPNTMMLIAGHLNDNRAIGSGVTTDGGLSWTTAYFTEHNPSGGSNDAAIGLLYANNSGTGALGPLQVDLDRNADSHGVLIALRPASSGLTIAVPGGTTMDDVMVASIAVRPNTISINTPAGWTLLRTTQQTSGGGASNRLATYYRTASGSEPASYTWTFSGGTHTGAVGGILSFAGVDSINPIDVENGNTTPNGFSHQANSVTTTMANTTLVSSHEFPSSTSNWTAPSGMTEAVDLASLVTPNILGVSLEMNYEARPTAGATGAKSATAEFSGTDAGYGAAHLLALAPAGTSTPAPLADWHMDEAAWSGAVGEVQDFSGNTHHSTRVGSAQTTIPGKICGAGNIPANYNDAAIDALDTGLGIDSQVGNAGTIAFWYRSNAYWSGGGDRQLFDASNAASGHYFFLALKNSGVLTFGLEDTADADARYDSPAYGFTADQWVHIAVTWDLPNDQFKTYVNGSLATPFNYPTNGILGSLLTLYLGDNRSTYHPEGTGNSANGQLDEFLIFRGVLTASDILSIYSNQDAGRNWDGTTRSCPAPSAPGGFNAFETGTAAGSIAGPIKTKIAGIAYSLDLVALDTAGTAIDTGFTEDVAVDLIANTTTGVALDTDNCPTTGTLLAVGTQAINNGRSTASFPAVADAWRDVRVRIRYPTSSPSVTACSSDNHAIRPAGFTAPSVTDGDWQTAGTTRLLANTSAAGGVVHKAGRPFTIQASARNAGGAPTVNYVGSPSVALTACVLPAAGCSLGTLTAGSWSAASGTVTSTTASYSEVGAFLFKLSDATFASVDVADSSAAERIIESIAVSVGRFVPDHFQLAAASAPQLVTFNDAACAARSFTYLGQPFGYSTLPQVAITARNAVGGTTANYEGALWKLTGADAAQLYTAPTGILDTGLINPPAISASGNGLGTLTTNSVDVLAFQRNTTTPQPPFNADITLTVSVTDDDEAGVSGNGIIATATPAVFGDIAFDAGDLFRYGRLRTQNAYGSELRALPMPMQTEYWNGTNFSLNGDDHCSTILISQIGLSNYQKNLSAGQTTPVLGGRFVSGQGNLRLTAPGADHSGSVDLEIDLAGTSWLQGRWSGAAYDDNPTARATFGIRKSADGFIFSRENY